MTEIMNFWSALRNDRRGVTAVEYGIMASLIAVAIIGGVTTLSTKLQGTFTSIGTALH